MIKLGLVQSIRENLNSQECIGTLKSMEGKLTCIKESEDFNLRNEETREVKWINKALTQHFTKTQQINFSNLVAPPFNLVRSDEDCECNVQEVSTSPVEYLLT